MTLKVDGVTYASHLLDLAQPGRAPLSTPTAVRMARGTTRLEKRFTAMLDSQRSRGIVLFTGERIASASARHILGEEASRALRLLRVREGTVARALDAAGLCRSDGGVEVCGAHAGTRGEPWRGVRRVCAAAARVGCANAERPRVISTASVHQNR